MWNPRKQTTGTTSSSRVLVSAALQVLLRSDSAECPFPPQNIAYWSDTRIDAYIPEQSSFGDPLGDVIVCVGSDCSSSTINIKTRAERFGTGRRISWTADIAGGQTRGRPAVDSNSGNIYVGTYGNQLYSFTHEGALNWIVRSGFGGYNIKGIAVDPNGTGRIVAGDNRNAIVFDANGNEFCRGTFPYASPYLGTGWGPDGNIYAVGTDSGVHSFDPNDVVNPCAWRWSTPEVCCREGIRYVHVSYCFSNVSFTTIPPFTLFHRLRQPYDRPMKSFSEVKFMQDSGGNCNVCWSANAHVRCLRCSDGTEALRLFGQAKPFATQGDKLHIPGKAVDMTGRTVFEFTGNYLNVPPAIDSNGDQYSGTNMYPGYQVCPRPEDCVSTLYKIDGSSGSQDFKSFLVHYLGGGLDMNPGDTALIAPGASAGGR